MSQNIFSLEGLISWLETKPPETTYCYTDIGGCLVYQYFHARGIPICSMGALDWSDTTGGQHLLPPGLNAVAVGNPRTYGGALQRAREMLEA